MIKLPSGVDINNLIDDIRIFSWQAADILLYYSKLLENSDDKISILKNNNETIGRIAAFYSSKNDKEKLRVGGCGFFECINNQKTANLLFDTAKEWLIEKGYNSMDGPINFGERDKWWGCLVEGFQIEPNYQQNYGKNYYQNLFEEYGFKLLFKQFTFLKKTRTPLSERLAEKAARAMKDPNYNFRTLEKNNMDKYVNDFTKIYNDAWSKYPGVSKLELSQAKLLFAQLKPILDEKILWFAYHNNDPVGFFISIPEMNQIFKHVNGKLDLFGKLKTFYHLKIKKYKSDASNFEASSKLVEDVIKDFGGFDILINNAGITKDNLIPVSYTHLTLPTKA